MKVLAITTVRFRQNGITTVMMNYFKNLNHDYVKMDFVGPNEIDENYSEILKKYDSNYFSLPMRKKNPLEYCKKLKQIMIDGEYDIVHIHGSSHLIALELFIAKMCRIKVRIAHSHSSSCEHKLLHYLLNPLFNITYTTAIGCSQEAGEWMFKNKSFTIINNGIELAKYQFNDKLREQLRNELSIKKSDYVIGNVAGFLNVKNQQYLIDLALEMKKKNVFLKFLLIGDGENFDEISSSIKNNGLGDQFILTGNIPDAYKYYNAMDLFILPSLYEGFPMVLVEAQANGLQCLVSDSVTQKTNLHGFVNYLPLNEKEQWIDFILSNMFLTRVNCSNAQKSLVELGYSVKDNCSTLVEIYKNELNIK